MAHRTPQQLAAVPINQGEIFRILESRIQQAGTLTLAATNLGISPQLLSAVLNQQRQLGPRLLKALGIRRTVQKVVTYELVGTKGGSRGRR